MRRVFLGCLALMYFTVAHDEVRLVGDECPVSVVTPATATQSHSVVPRLLYRSDLGSIFVPVESRGFVAEPVSEDAELEPTCEMRLIDRASVRDVIREVAGESDDLGVIWELAGQREGNKLKVTRGRYRFRLTFLIDNPRKQRGQASLWTVRSPTFQVEEDETWTTFR